MKPRSPLSSLIAVVTTGLFGWAVTILMAVWGGVYLYQCYLTLSQPGVPLALEYATEAGSRVFRAESFVIDPWQRTVELSRPSIADDSGGSVVSADRLHIGYETPLLRVKSQGLALRLRRESTGRFDIQSFLPKTQPGKFGPPYVFEADQIVVDYTDLQGQPIRHQALVRHVRVDQDRGDVTAAGDLTVPGLQPATFALQLAPDSQTWLTFSRLEGDATRLLPLAVRFLPANVQKEMTKVKLADLSVSGSLELAIRGKEVGLGGNLSLMSSRLVYDQKIGGRLMGRVQGSLESASVTASLSDARNKASFDGRVAFPNGALVAGTYRFTSGDRSWPLLNRLIPKDIRVQRVDSAGWVSYDRGVVSATGRGRVGSFMAKGERLDNVAARFAYQGSVARIQVDRATWRQGPVAGSLIADTKTMQVLGEVTSPVRPIAPLLASFGAKGITGSGQAAALVSGKFDALRIDLYAKGKAVVRDQQGSVAQAGPFEARLALIGNKGTLQRLTVSGPNGILVADGQADLKTRALDARFIAGALPVSLLNKDASGTVFAQGRVSGTLEAPKYVAHVEGYGLEYKDQGAPLLVAELEGDKSKLSVTSLQANSGTGLLNARADIDLKTKSVNGNFIAKNLALSQWLGSEVLGTVDLSEGVVKGTYDKPSVTARLKGDKVYAYGTSVDAVDLFLAASLDEVRVTEGDVRIGDGHISAQADYRFETQAGRVSLNAESLPLDRLLRLGPTLAFDGRAGGTFVATGGPNGWTGSGALNVANVLVNDTPLGAGNLDLQLKDKSISANGTIGSIDRYFGLDAFSYDLDTRQATGEASAYNLQVRDLVSATRPMWDQAPAQTIDLLETLAGSFSGKARVTADSETWSLTDSKLKFEQLQIGGRDAGSLTADISRNAGVWRASDLLWKSGDSTFSASGTYDEAGTIDVLADLNDFDLTWVSVFAPQTPVLNGRASVHVQAAGPSDDPSGRATVFVNNATVHSTSGQSTSDPVQVLLDNVTFGNKRAQLSGQANFSGFSGALSAEIPYSSLQSGSRSRRREPLQAKIELKERPIQDFADHLPDVDMQKSDGTVQFSALLNGLIEDLKIDADAAFNSKRLAFMSVETELLDSRFTYHQSDRKAQIAAQGTSSQGGSFNVGLNGNLADIFGSDFNLDELLDESTLSGSAKFDQFKWAEKIMGAQNPTVARVDGNISVGGSLRNPRFGGDAIVENLVLNLPGEIAPSSGGSLPIDPIMDNIRLQIAQGSRIETGVGALFVSGVGVLNGSLSEPNVNIPLRLDSGTFRLPSGRLSLEPGGELIFNYSSIGGGDPVARVNLDLEGHTNIVSQRSTGNYETYQVTINIRGNVLDERSLVLSATSDPGDLSQDEILALIGQRDLIEGIAQGVLGGSGDRGVFRDAFYSIAIPNLSQNLTQGIAQGLDLDYVTVDYNPFDQFMLRAGKTIGKGLVLEGARQLQNTGFGPTKWEARLVYRLPLADRFFSRVRLAFGLDQSVPWKFSVNWSRRF